jgi:hypothetical protein
MSCPQPTGERATVALELPAPQAKILRGAFASCLEGAADDLRSPGRLQIPNRVQQEADAYRRLLSALDAGEIALPDEEARSAVEGMALSIEEDTDYRRLIAEHDALFGLLDLLGGVREKAS